MVNHRYEAKALLHRITAKEDVFPNCSCRNWLKFLMDHCNSLLQGIHRVCNGCLFSIDQKFTFIHLVDSEHTLHQGGLSSSILTHQRMNLSRAKA